MREPLGRVAAYITGFARTPFWDLAKVRADLAMAASSRLGIPANFVIALPGALLFRRIGDLVDKIGQQSHVALLPQQDAISRLPIAPCASGLLIVLLDRLGQREMDH